MVEHPLALPVERSRDLGLVLHKICADNVPVSLVAAIEIPTFYFTFPIKATTNMNLNRIW